MFLNIFTLAASHLDLSLLHLKMLNIETGNFLKFCFETPLLMGCVTQPKKTILLPFSIEDKLRVTSKTGSNVYCQM